MQITSRKREREPTTNDLSNGEVNSNSNKTKLIYIKNMTFICFRNDDDDDRVSLSKHTYNEN